MGTNILASVIVVLLIAFTISGIIKLRIYKVESKVYYTLTPIFPILVLFLNISAIMNTEDEEINAMPIFKRLLFTIFVSVTHLPFFYRLIMWCR